jgi:CRISPR/Cas system-associated exonuclease Cas4 (RecB family)
VVAIPERILSPTAINSYLSCPRKFYLRYIEKRASKPSIHLVRGGLVHKAIQRFHQEPALPPSTLDPGERLAALFEAEWAGAEQTLSKMGLPPEELETFHQDSLAMLAVFADWLKASGLDGPAEAESRLFSKDLGLMGIVDAVYRMDGETVLVDYKTSKQDTITPDIQRQAAIYALLHGEKHGIVPSEVWIHFLKFQDGLKSIEVSEDLVEYARLLTEFVHLKTASKAEADYPCTCGGWCERDFREQ